MLVLKSSGIDLSKSETRTIIGFSLIYSILVLVILGVITFLYYQFKKDLMIQDKRQTLQNYSNTHIANLKELHINIDKSDIYPRDERFNSAIYDSSKKKIFSTLLMNDVKLDEVIYLKDGYIHLIKEPESYYLGSKYIIVEIEDDNIWFANIKYKMLFWFLFSFILLLFVGYFIAKLFLKPIKNERERLNNFIKDTTHELNTPISAIIMSCEDDNLTKKQIDRIKFSAKRVSEIYKDLTYIFLGNIEKKSLDKIDLSKVIKEEIINFEPMIARKRLKINLNIEEFFYEINKDDFIRLFNNLFSNAIKYNKTDGNIDIILQNSELIIKDSGIGISKDKIKDIFNRYYRATNQSGGFGLGLNIVNMICKTYNIKIDVQSSENIGSTFTLKL